MNRRSFSRKLAMALPLSQLNYPVFTKSKSITGENMKSIHINKVVSNFEREPLIRPFGFKGNAMTNVWQTVARIESQDGISKIGLGTQNVLWSDSKVFADHSENGGNAIMYAMTDRALQMVKGTTFNDPITLLDQTLPEVYEYGKQITRNPDLRKTFALNALVPVDNAAWLLYAAENGINQFDEMIPAIYRPALSARQKKVASIPALGYGTAMSEIKNMADQGFFIMKIKIGAPGSQQEMLEKDKEFLSAIHKAIGHYKTPHTADGKIPYYFDANGRYEKKETLMRFLDYAKKIGALEQIAVVEEPFGERNNEDVRDITALGPRVAADESAHTDEDALKRIEQGYNCIALKAIAKTLSMTLKIAKVADDHNIPCFCADLTVNPILVEWNKCVAARLKPFPELPGLGLQETNGWQNYRNWDKMKDHHPKKNARWTKSVKGVYETDEAFFGESGGIFLESEHYEKMF